MMHVFVIGFIVGCCLLAASALPSQPDGGSQSDAEELNSSGGCLIQVSRGAKLTSSGTSQSAASNISAALISEYSHRNISVPAGFFQETAPPSFFHSVVGNGGALMIALKREPKRAAIARAELAKVGIYASMFDATDGRTTSPAELDKGCSRECGCKEPVIQSIAHSHLRALQQALKRQQEWTAIFEDDAVPVAPDGIDWDAEFKKAWTRLPPKAKVVRLGWCQAWYIQQMHPAPSDVSKGRFHWMQFQTKDVGACTHAYMVHKSIIPSMLGAFPCCCAVDCCYGAAFFAKQDPAILTNLIAVGGDEYINNRGGNGFAVGPHMVWRGVVMQEQLGSSTHNRLGGISHLAGKVSRYARSLYDSALLTLR